MTKRIGLLAVAGFSVLTGCAELKNAPVVDAAFAADSMPALRKVRLAEGRLMLGESEYRAIGVNIPHLSQAYLGTWHHCNQIYGTEAKMRQAIIDALEDAARHQVAFIRFFAEPGSPYAVGRKQLYDTNREEYWRRMDELFALCRNHGIRVIPVLSVTIWQGFYFPKEPVRAVLNPDSQTYQDLRTYVHDFVTRYQDDPTVLMWSLSNEAFLKAGIDRGSAEKTVSFELLTETYKHWTAYIKSLAPNAIVTSGDGAIRQESISRRTAVKAALAAGEWPPKYEFRPDALKEHLEQLVESQAPVDVASTHAYVRAPGERDSHYLGEKLGSQEYLRKRVRAMRAAGKPVLIGEFAQIEPFFREDPTARVALDALDMLDQEGVSLVAVWVWHFHWQDSDYRQATNPIEGRFNIAAGVNHPALMKRMAEFNRRYAGQEHMKTKE